jgi:hypothetical protein
MIAPVFQIPCLKEGFDEPQEAAIVELLSQDGQQDLMIKAVIALSDIPLDEPGRSRPRVVDVRERSMAAALRAEAVGGAAKLRFVVGL